MMSTSDRGKKETNAQHLMFYGRDGTGESIRNLVSASMIHLKSIWES
jgi:hypothetical protein